MVVQKAHVVQNTIVLRENCTWVSPLPLSWDYWLGHVCGFRFTNPTFGVSELI